jgi:CBS domain-containing protein
MTIGKIIKNKVITIHSTGTVQQAANLMYENHVGTVVVVNKRTPSKNVFIGKETTLGIVTDRDIALAYGKNETMASDYPVVKVMTKNVVMCSPNDGIYATISKMRQNGIRRMPVINSDDHLMGIIESDDLLLSLSEELGELSDIVSNENMNENKIKRPIMEGSQLRSIFRTTLY